MPDDINLHMPPNRALKPNFLTQTRFEDFNLPAEITAGLLKAGFEYCTPIQAQVLPISLKGLDVAGQAQTGTGKTAAFLVTIFARLLAQSKTPSHKPSAIIVAPTRELASQIYEDARILGIESPFKISQIVGGIDYQKQADILTKGTDIVVCTPGRIIDYFKQGIFKTTDIKILVIDEADRLLDLGFAQDMRFILKKLPHYDKRQSMLFSATLSHRVMELTYEYMNLPEFISVTPEEITVDGINQRLFHVGNDEKLSLLLGLLEREPWDRALIFANTKVGVQWITQKLKGNRLPAEGITGDLPQVKRFRLMKRFKEGSIKILVATDVASRGIHVEDITHVFNYDLPQDSENYIHRIGRTARAGKTGHAISFACEKYVYHLEPLEQMLGFSIPVVWPEHDWFKSDLSGPVSIGRKKPGRRPGRKRGRVMQKKQVYTAKNGNRNRQKGPGSDAPRSFPGAFFGFGPKPVDEKPTTPSEKKNSSGKK
jgi:ATP-dependent RNA helicase RhlB